MDKLTEEDLRHIHYYWKYERNLEVYSDFDKLVPKLERWRPEIIKAWRDYKASEKIMDLVIGGLEDE